MRSLYRETGPVFSAGVCRPNPARMDCDKKSTSKHLLQAELDYLGKFLSRLNEKGVHASVTLAEAKQGLVGLYFFLFNVCQHSIFRRSREQRRPIHCRPTQTSEG